MKITVVLNKNERKEFHNPDDLEREIASKFDCALYDVNIIEEEQQRAVHKQIDMSFFFQGMTNDPELEGLKVKLYETINAYFTEQNSMFMGVVELKNRH